MNRVFFNLGCGFWGQSCFLAFVELWNRIPCDLYLVIYSFGVWD